jgi:hypothetical protein
MLFSIRNSATWYELEPSKDISFPYVTTLFYARSMATYSNITFPLRDQNN